MKYGKRKILKKYKVSLRKKKFSDFFFYVLFFNILLNRYLKKIKVIICNKLSGKLKLYTNIIKNFNNIKKIL